MKKAILWTDGACVRNPGAGGWSCFVFIGDSKYPKILKGGVPQTTNNRMEIQAVLEGLRSLKESHEVTIYSDSKYVVNGINDWLKNWIEKNWYRDKKKEKWIKNVDLWSEMWEHKQNHSITAKWVKGHKGIYWNEKVDQVAETEASLQDKGIF